MKDPVAEFDHDVIRTAKLKIQQGDTGKLSIPSGFPHV
jgi:hypothetical protein